MAVSAASVKELRERTGLGMMECKKALQEVGGDVDKAIEELRKNSGLKAAKKAGRTAAEGIVVVKTEGGYGMIVEVNSETDFAAKNEDFVAFSNNVADAAFAAKNTEVAGLLNEDREAIVQKIGENISPRRAVEAEGEIVAGYVHSNNRLAALVALKGGNEDVARDIAMHVTAVNPRVLTPEDMPAEEVQKEEDIIKAQPDMEGKPAEIVEKMMGGRIKKFLKENSLLEQPFVKNPEQTVGQLAKEAGAEVVAFVRLEVGEGIEKDETDFAAEVAAQLKG
ncbi:elongation factor Ts [Bermanella marisrubri]|uniref:Elongation factor Ts n=1 Tax=Bermanella marisrubri TaxID=207949 RepID=Q1N1X3_9GAMM|nr:translation elongation factor Ts [Bermanella marisrubri]EAT12158.1 translation elongation factor Ts [Oceanobacter sp. RED65] [Bermanella marisrubri]QIZ83634.1 elongation factor Ts [Bermanella marisrubri]